MINLYVNYYNEPNHIRKAELDYCLRKNILNKELNVIVIEQNNRPTFKEFFNYINKVSNKDDVNIIANTDIYFESLEQIKRINYNQMFALSRYDVEITNGIVSKIEFNPRNNSQDVWIMKGCPVGVYGDFEIGLPGCDNRIAYEFSKATYEVSNPSLSIRTYHLHNSGIRNYVQGKLENTIPPPYKYLEPSHVNI